MTNYIFGFWGGYFGATGLTLAGALFAFSRRLHRIALNGAIATTVSAVFVLSFLGAMPFDLGTDLHRCLGVLCVAVGFTLFYMLLSVLGLLRLAPVRRRVIVVLVALAASTSVAGFLLPPADALKLGLGTAHALGLLAGVLCVRSARRGDSLAWMLLFAVFALMLALAGLGWIALDRLHVPWFVHAVSALAATAYISVIAIALWMRYSYLIELKEVMVHGPSYDPVTRMRTHQATGGMVGDAFKNYRSDAVPLGLIVVSIGNLPVLQKLYGQAAVNHALFVCAGRLRRAVPVHVDMGRLADDSFLLLVRGSSATPELLALALAVQSRLSRSVVLQTNPDALTATRHQTRWAAEIGVGVQRIWRVDARAAKAVVMVRGMSRTAWSYPSRVAWYDDDRGEIMGVPLPAR